MNTTQANAETLQIIDATFKDVEAALLAATEDSLKALTRMYVHRLARVDLMRQRAVVERQQAEEELRHQRVRATELCNKLICAEQELKELKASVAQPLGDSPASQESP